MSKLSTIKEIFALFTHKKKISYVSNYCFVNGINWYNCISTKRSSGIHFIRFKMELSSPRFKGYGGNSRVFFLVFYNLFSYRFYFSFEALAVFIVVTLAVTQIFSLKLSRALDIFAIINTKIFLGILFVFVVSLYGIFFKALHIDLLRLKKQESSLIGLI